MAGGGGMVGTLMSVGQQLTGALKDSKKIENSTFQSINKGLDKFGSVADSVKGVAKQDTGLGAASSALGSVGDAAMSGGPIGMAIGAALKVAGAALSSVEKLQQAGENQLAGNFKFDSNPSMSAIKSDKEMADKKLDYEKGSEQAGVAKGLSESQQQMNRQLAVVDNWWTDFKGQVIETGQRTFSAIAAPLLGDGKPDTTKPQAISTNEWMADAGKQYMEKVARRPKRLGGRQ